MKLRVTDSGTYLDFRPESVIVAGFTGRDTVFVERHLAELRQHGVAVPASTPVYYPIPPSLLTADSTITVTSAETSGEVEPVLLFCNDSWYVGVGSDHTARDVERHDIGRSKAAVPKIVSTTVWPYENVLPHWDDLILQSWTCNGRRAPYQEGSLADLLPAPRILKGALDGHEPRDDVAVFLGTVPLLFGEFQYAPGYEMRLHDPHRRRELRCTYSVIRG